MVYSILISLCDFSTEFMSAFLVFQIHTSTFWAYHSFLSYHHNIMIWKVQTIICLVIYFLNPAYSMSYFYFYILSCKIIIPCCLYPLVLTLSMYMVLLYFLFLSYVYPVKNLENYSCHCCYFVSHTYIVLYFSNKYSWMLSYDSVFK